MRAFHNRCVTLGCSRYDRGVTPPSAGKKKGATLRPRPSRDPWGSRSYQ
ncbi:hypothetical protein LF41_2303 [Lysobacter dokdonensis DS-58]|uniref:Uncharacterized protein n=1 Tax=Lysobacter dokdonensis DS-58 TaxID=1300345 RepID=A0A0A2WHZ0_9GAMM|nr:hypothetical protein LF41_2303 [Lysobacter dokdonensis DS-58]